MCFTAKPTPPTNCSLHLASNHSSDELEVECRAGYDGGLPQTFVLEAYDSYNLRLRFNLSSSGGTDAPSFRFELSQMLASSGHGLPHSLTLAVFSENAKGRSERVVVDEIPLSDAEKRTGM